MERTSKALCLVLAIVALCLGGDGTFSWPGKDSTGCLEGRITDRFTRRPLCGVSIVVEKTELGAATDSQGQYLIIGVPPGKQEVCASYIGYDAQRMEVAVRPGATSRANFALGYMHHEPVQWPKPARLFEFGRVSFAPLAASSGLRATNAGGSARNSLRWELGSFAYGLKLRHWPALLVGFKLAEWFDEGGTRDGQPAFLPVYVYAMHDPLLIRASRWGLAEPRFYAYVMGSVSRSAGAGIGVHAPWNPRALRKLSLRFTPGLELAWTRSWNDDVSFSRLSLSLSLGLGQWYVRPTIHIL
jgi:hypothetical protein